jgi:hypothetical protein
MGYTTTELGGGVDADLWDRVNTVNVDMISATLSSYTELEVMNGKGRYLVGGEIIGAATATLEADGTYTLSTLLRGCRNTETLIDGHSTVEAFLVLDGAGVAFNTYNADTIGNAWEYRAVATGGTVADFDSVPFTHGAANITPWSVAGAQFRHEPSSLDIEIKWRRRSRSFVSVFGGAGAPMNEVEEAYSLRFYDATFTTLKGGYVTDEPEFDYTEAFQIDDYGSAQSTVYVVIAQVSQTVGDGRTLEVSG